MSLKLPRPTKTFQWEVFQLAGVSGALRVLYGYVHVAGET